MKGKVLFFVLGLLVAFRGEAETKPQPTQKEAQEAWRLKNHTPEEMEVWRKIESIRHPGSEVVLWEPLTAAEIQKRERESRQLREAAREAQEHLVTIQAGRTVDRAFDYANNIYDKMLKDWKEANARAQEDIVASRKRYARAAEEAAARKEADDKAWQEKRAREVAEAAARKETDDKAWKEKRAREAEEAAARHEADKKRWQENSERDALRRERELDAWYLGFKETNPHFYESIVKYRKANGKPLPGYLVNAGKGPESAQLTIVYQVPLTLSLNVVGSRDVDFSEVWKDALPRKTLTLRGATNAPQAAQHSMDILRAMWRDCLMVPL